MSVPDYQTIMLPLLQLASDNREHQLREATETLADQFSLTNDERNELLPSGIRTVFSDRVSWARTYLKQAGLLSCPHRGSFRITNTGFDLLQEGPKSIDVKLLERYPSFLEFRNRRRDSDSTPLETLSESGETPEDALADAYRKLRGTPEAELLQQIEESSPTFFEQLVVDLLVKMGYGGSRQDAGRAIGRIGDGGIDGIINEDRLGSDVIYIQAKRWDVTVGRPEIQRFAGALQGQRARKGVFITTSEFSKDAQEYASRIDSRIILIDGARLANLLVDYNVGVSLVGAYEVKKLDLDYFTGG
jgi:restriction system protein